MFPIVFGYSALEADNDFLLNLNEDVYMEYIKNNQYKRADERGETEHSKITRFLNKGEKINVFVLGHSCGLSDGNLLNEIFKHENVLKIHFFHFDKFENYTTMKNNFERITQNNKVNHKLTNFEVVDRIPQYNDDNSKINEFNKRVNKLFYEIYTNSILPETLSLSS